MSVKEAGSGEFSLMINKNGKVHPVALTLEQHEMLQVYIDTFKEVRVVESIEITYKR